MSTEQKNAEEENTKQENTKQENTEQIKPGQEAARRERAEAILKKQFVMTDAGRIDKIIDLYTTYNDKVDLQALIDGGYVDVLDRMMEPVTMSYDDHSPEVIAYWAKQGMVKEFHGENVPMSWSEYEAKTGYHWDPVYKGDGAQNNFKKWNSFVPVSAFDPANAGRKYPVVFVLHGGFNPISIIDGWGWVQEAAKREWIVIAPSIELDSVLEEILEEAKKLYPVDEARVYCCGFSYGGFMTDHHGNKRPDLFAAVAPCGAPISDAFCEKAIGPEPQEPFDGIPRCLAMKTYMPVINIYGNLDGFRFPYYNATTFLGRPSGPDVLIAGINSWAKANDADPVDPDKVMALKDRDDISIVEKNIGLPLAEDCQETVTRQGITSHIASIRSHDGIVRIRIMCEMNMPHWPTPEMSFQAFEFFSHFARDPKTKESLYFE